MLSSDAIEQKAKSSIEAKNSLIANLQSLLQELRLKRTLDQTCDDRLKQLGVFPKFLEIFHEEKIRVSNILKSPDKQYNAFISSSQDHDLRSSVISFGSRQRNRDRLFGCIEKSYIPIIDEQQDLENGTNTEKFFERIIQKAEEPQFPKLFLQEADDANIDLNKKKKYFISLDQSIDQDEDHQKQWRRQLFHEDDAGLALYQGPESKEIITSFERKISLLELVLPPVAPQDRGLNS